MPQGQERRPTRDEMVAARTRPNTDRRSDSRNRSFGQSVRREERSRPHPQPKHCDDQRRADAHEQGSLKRFGWHHCAGSMSLMKSDGERLPPLAMMMGRRHLCGTLPRCRHLRLASGFTPRRCAIRSISGQLVLSLFVMGSDYGTNRPSRQAQFVQRRLTMRLARLNDGG